MSFIQFSQPRDYNVGVSPYLSKNKLTKSFLGVEALAIYSNVGSYLYDQK